MSEDNNLPLRADLIPVQSLPSIFMGVVALGICGAFVLIRLPFYLIKKKIKESYN